MTDPTPAAIGAASRVDVALGDRSYDIHIGPGLLARAGDLIAPVLRRKRTFIVTDQTVAGLHLEPLRAAFAAAGIESAAVVLPAGEGTKCYAQLEHLTGRLLDAGAERSDMIVALGGGVIGDLTGFAASVLRRGVDFVQVPTTLLAQVDSSVGGKVAINVPQGKNLIGAFHQPRLVLCDIDVLNTLPAREFMAGFAEVVKYGLLGDDAFFGWLEQNGRAMIDGDAGLRQQAVTVSCTNKAAVVAADEREAGQRALLNLGHTFGHALEAETGYSSTLLHGEGVAIGMMMAFQFSQDLNLCAPADVARVSGFYAAAGLPGTVHDIAGYGSAVPRFSADKLLHHMYQDKKVSDGKLTFVLTKGIGQAFVQKDVAPDDVLRFLERIL